MIEKSDKIKAQPRFDVVMFHYCVKDQFRLSEWAYSLPHDPNAGDEIIEHCKALGGAIWPVGRTVHVFMAGGRS